MNLLMKKLPDLLNVYVLLNACFVLKESMVQGVIKMNEYSKYILIISIVLIIIVIFSIVSPIGIKIFYSLSGGKEPDETVAVNTDKLKQEYYIQVNNYERYYGSDNAVQQKWALNAKNRANEIADEYNSVIGNKELELIG